MGDRPRAMLTMRMRSSMVTSPSPLQSPTQGLAATVAVGVTDGVGVGGAQSNTSNGLQARNASGELLRSFGTRLVAEEEKPIQRPSALIVAGKSATPWSGSEQLRPTVTRAMRPWLSPGGKRS